MNYTCKMVTEKLDDLWIWSPQDKFIDGYKIGDENNMIKKIGVMWKPKLKDLKKAYKDGCNFIIAHESIAAMTDNSSNKSEASFALEEEKEKFDYLEKNNIVIYRCHDLWDRMKNIGVRDTWQNRLFGHGHITKDDYPYYVTEIEPMKLKDLAKHVLEKIRELGQESVIVTGDLNQTVFCVATGTGVSVDTIKMKNMGADVGIITDDYQLHVRYGVLNDEMNFPTITVNHNVAEEWAINNLSNYLKEVFQDIEIIYYPQECPYKTIY